MKRIPWNEATPGHFEVDLVHHGRATSSGDYVHTLQRMDVTTARSKRGAVLGRSYGVMEDTFQRVLKRLPFPVLELHPDNGREFFNAHLVRFSACAYTQTGGKICFQTWPCRGDGSSAPQRRTSCSSR